MTPLTPAPRPFTLSPLPGRGAGPGPVVPTKGGGRVSCVILGELPDLEQGRQTPSCSK